jgi:hypothetical protein
MTSLQRVRARLFISAAALGITAALLLGFVGVGGTGPRAAHAQGYPVYCPVGYVSNGYQCVPVSTTAPGATCMPGYRGGITCSGPVNWSGALYPFASTYVNSYYPVSYAYPFGYASSYVPSPAAFYYRYSYSGFFWR